MVTRSRPIAYYICTISSIYQCMSAFVEYDRAAQSAIFGGYSGFPEYIPGVNLKTAKGPTSTKKSFSVYWNIPTQPCLAKYGINVDVSKYNIFTNLKDGWAGENITIFPRAGLYPEVHNGIVMHGGIPQNVLLEQHVAQLRVDIDARIPNKNFEGLAIVDYEAWQPLWLLNFDSREVYRTMSVDLVRKRHPEWTKEKITTVAEKQFEEAARKFLEVTMSTAQASRPGGRWGFYHYPYCFSRDDIYPSRMLAVKCQEFAEHTNDRLIWLFRSENVLYPSAYLISSGNATFNGELVNARLGEAKRVQNMIPHHRRKIPVYMYSNLLYKEGKEFYKRVDLDNTIRRALVTGLDGVVIWGDHDLSRNISICNNVKTYVDKVLGPYVQQLLKQISNVNNL